MIFTLGSINRDLVYDVAHLPRPGETITAAARREELGGKGANQSVAMARAGARVAHLGAVGADGADLVAALAAAGVDCAGVARRPGPSGHAMILREPGGENLIVVHPGANRDLEEARIVAALGQGGPGDWLVMQNETSGQLAAAREARARGMRVVHSAAPFEAEAVRALAGLVDLLLLNETEAAALGAAGIDPGGERVVTLGARGARWHRPGAPALACPGRPVTVRDTTAAGDTFAGYLVVALAEGQDRAAALDLATAAAALKVTRAGTAAAIPSRAEVEAFRAGR